jgi:hypothetical protein
MTARYKTGSGVPGSQCCVSFRGLIMSTGSIELAHLSQRFIGGDDQKNKSKGFFVA